MIARQAHRIAAPDQRDARGWVSLITPSPGFRLANRVVLRYPCDRSVCFPSRCGVYGPRRSSKRRAPGSEVGRRVTDNAAAGRSEAASTALLPHAAACSADAPHALFLGLTGQTATARARDTAAVINPAACARIFARTSADAAVNAAAARVADDPFIGSTSCDDIAATTTHIVAALRRREGETGMFHLCGAPKVGLPGSTREIFRQALRIGWPALAPILSAARPTSVIRPMSVARAYGLGRSDWRVLRCVVQAGAASTVAAGVAAVEDPRGLRLRRMRRALRRASR